MLAQPSVPPLPLPQESPRSCEVHSCVLVEGDEPCAEGRAEACDGPRGHLRPIGEQWDSLGQIREHDLRREPLDAPTFWRETVSKFRPLVLRGAAAEWSQAGKWTDEALAAECQLSNGQPWQVLVEKYNRIVSNSRHPLMHGWDFCHFLRQYRRPEWANMLRGRAC